MPMPSLSSVPSASLSNGRMDCVAESAFSRQNRLNTGAGVATCIPPTSARS